MENVFGDLLNQYGPAVATFGFFLYRDWRREEQQAASIDKLAAQLRETEAQRVQDLKTVIANNTQAMVDMKTACANMADELQRARREEDTCDGK